MEQGSGGITFSKIMICLSRRSLLTAEMAGSSSAKSCCGGLIRARSEREDNLIVDSSLGDAIALGGQSALNGVLISGLLWL